MNAAVALHTAARRYCLERVNFWHERYYELMRRGGDRGPDGYHYTPEALRTFPRYNVLDAIRVELERIDPASLGDFEEARELLILAGQIAEDISTRHRLGNIEQQATTEEREAFCRYVGGLSPSDVRTVEPLPFRRVLTGEESHELWSRLRERWQMTGHHWYPLADCTIPDVVSFQSQAFEEAVPTEQLQAILAMRKIERVWELREWGPPYEEDISLFEPDYGDGGEGYWSSGDLDWIVYASHEDSITVGGWLLQELQAIWPSWHEKVYTSWSESHE